MTLWFNSCLPKALIVFLQGEQTSLETMKEGLVDFFLEVRGL